jgi:GTP-binding protein
LEIKSVSFHRAAYQPGDFPRDQRPQFAMVGRSNVGKSSLLNAVVNRKGVARVSQTPGKTQAVHFYLVNDRFYIVDLPGYGYAKVAKNIKSTWAALVRGYLEEADALRVMFLLVDSRREPNEADLQMHDWAVAAGIDEKLIMTKSDKLSRSQLLKSKAMIAGEMKVSPDDVIAFSAVTKQGIEDVRREIAARL